MAMITTMMWLIVNMIMMAVVTMAPMMRVRFVIFTTKIMTTSIIMIVLKLMKIN